MKRSDINTNHRFLDEAGDITFYGKGKINIVGNQGVSNCFILGMVKFKEPLNVLRQQVIDMQKKIETESYYKDIPSINKKKAKGGFFFHATDDIPEVRKEFFEFIKNMKVSFEAVVGRKIPKLYETKHNGKEQEFYADLLAHLLKTKFGKEDKLVLNIAERGKSTKNTVLTAALKKAKQRFMANKQKDIITKVVFNIQNHQTEPLLNIADYFCWAVQRVFERGETRFYDYIYEKISLVIDLYDSSKYDSKWGNYYGPKNRLTPQNKICPQKH